MKLYDTGVYLQNGHDIIPAGQADFPVSKEEAAKNTRSNLTNLLPMILLLWGSSRLHVHQDLKDFRFLMC